MRYHEIMTESFDRPLPYTWIEQGERCHMATFQIGDVSYWIKAYQTRGRLPPDNDVKTIWVLNFGIDPETSKRLHGHEFAIMKPTGLQQSTALVIGTVAAALDEFIDQQRPPLVWMSDTDSNRGRARLYSRYADHLIKHFGYQFNEPIMQHFAGQSIWCLHSG
jgi:hypothetical protein